MERKQLKPWQGIVTFVAMMVIFLVIAIPVQSYLGLIGVAITEFLLLAMAIAAALIFKQDLKEVFPFRVPRLCEIIGTLLFWCGGFLLCMVATLFVTVISPQGMEATSSGLSNVMTDGGAMWFSIFVVSLLPAICEEAVHRGFILHTFKGVKKEWVTVLAMGLIFGVFHMDPFRFLTTAVLGACLTWVMLKTKNMVIPMLFHAVNNLVPVLVSFATLSAANAAAGQSEQAADAVTQAAAFGRKDYLIAFATYLILAAVAPPLMTAGTALLKPKGEKVKGKYVAVAFILSGVLVIAGIAILVANISYILEMQGISIEDLGL